MNVAIEEGEHDVTVRPASAAPRDRAVPIVGRVVQAYQDLLGALMDVNTAHGDVVWVSVGGLKPLAVFGPDAAEVVFRNTGGAFSNRAGWQTFLDHVFPGAILAMDGPEHRVQRRIMQAAFTTASLRDYVKRMVPALSRGIDAWGQRHEFLAYPAVKQLTLDVATSTFLGVQPGADTARLNRAFVDAVDASIAMIRLDVWPTAYHRGLRGRAIIESHLRSLLDERRQHRLPDLLSQMCFAESEEGERFSDEEVVRHMSFVMMAAHDTSASTLTTTLYHLAKHPEWQERLRVQSVALPDALDYEALTALEEMGWVISEALRMHPPLPVIPRVTVKPVEVNGFRVPAGTLVMIPVLHTHHDPRWWSAPLRFDPERFAPKRSEQRRHKHVWTPFGGGAHRCIGERFGLLEIKAALHLMLKRYRWSVSDSYEMPYRHVPIARPRDGLPLRLQAIGPSPDPTRRGTSRS
jgi:cytochrome P450